MRKHMLIIFTIFLSSSAIKSAQGKPKIYVTSIPKSGSHMLMRCIELITGKKLEFPRLPRGANLHEHRMKNFFPTISRLSEQLRIKPHQYFWSHLRYTPEYETFLEKNNVALFLMIRDPRDQLVSRVFWYKQNKQKGFVYHYLPFDRLLSSVIGRIDDPQLGIKSWIPVFNTDPDALDNIVHQYQEFLPWSNWKNCCTICFEDLVGSRGGGDDKLQELAILKIAKHAGVTLSSEKLKLIQKKLYGNTNTFRRGKIGSWKKHFTATHKEQFKKVGNELLTSLGYEDTIDW